MENKPTRLPIAWPTDGRSRLKNLETGWTLTHPDRESVVYKDDRWEQAA